MKTFLYLSFLSFSFSMLFGQVSYNQEFLVSQIHKSDWNPPSITALEDGGWVVCWISNGDIYFHLHNEDGSIRQQETKVTSENEEEIYSTGIISLPNGGFAVSWASFSNSDLYGQIYNKDGLVIGDKFHISDAFVNEDFYRVFNFSETSFIFVWENIFNDSGSIHGQIFNLDGTKRGLKIDIAPNGINPSVGHSTDNNFVVSWHNENDLFRQIYDSNGNKIGQRIKLNTNEYGYSYLIHDFNDDTFLLSWKENKTILGQYYNVDGSSIGESFDIINEDIYINDVSITDNKNDLTLISWNRGDGSIYIKFLNNDGSLHGISFKVTENATGLGSSPGHTFLQNGNIAFCWPKMLNDNRYEIYAKYYLDELFNHPLQPFSLLKPDYDTTLNTTETVFKWPQASSRRINLPWELEYKIYLDEDESFSNPRIISQIYDTTYTVDSLKPGTTYFWKVLAKNIDSDSLWSSETNAFFVSHDAVTSIDEMQSEHPQTFELFANYPNPFNPETSIKYSLPAGQTIYNVKVKIYNALGQLIEVLVDSNQKPGMYTVKWKASNVPSGIYFCRIEARQFSATQKMLLVR